MTVPSGDRAPSRVIVERVEPEVDAGLFAVKRCVGETLSVRARVFTDGHDLVACALLVRTARDTAWREIPMRPVDVRGATDVYGADIDVTALEPLRYTVEGWIDEYGGYARGLQKKVQARQDVAVDLLIGAELLQGAADRATGTDRTLLTELAKAVAGKGDEREVADRVLRALDPHTVALARRHPDRGSAFRYPKELAVDVDRERARFSAWYELFPRSTSSVPGQHGTFADCAARLPSIQHMGFDVVYLPPIHPIGRIARKGKNNAEHAAPGDVGSPWAIGADEGGHTAIHPELGTVDDFRAFLQKAGEHALEVALDLAFQCAPDHPWVKQHPGWFKARPDGTIQYAENPPKKYQDIFPIDFECADWKALWSELLAVVRHWIDLGVRIFRVDNPHTKPFRFWQWLIAEVRRENPEVIFLAEAFTRPNVMYQLAKLGFAQSYNYFPWRNTKHDLTTYLTELTTTEVKDWLRPNLWPNTPDILPEPLQHGGRATFVARFILAATLGASYGIYGPAYELCEGRARVPGSEDYLDSEKYQLHPWNLEHPDSLKELIARVNHIRRAHPALQSNERLRFLDVDNEQLLAYLKQSADGSDVVVVVVNLDPHHVQSGTVTIPVDAFGLDDQTSYQMHDVLSGARYLWSGRRGYVELDPNVVPAHIFHLQRRLRTENDFDYFM